MAGVCNGIISGALIGGILGGAISWIFGGSFLEGVENGAFMGAIGGAIGGGMTAAMGGAAALSFVQTVFIGGVSGASSSLIGDVSNIIFGGADTSLGQILANMFASAAIGALFSAAFYGLSKAFASLKLKISGKTETTTGTSGADLNDTYEGVRQASEYLKSQGVPREYRKQILESFDVETIKVITAGDSTYGLRFYGGGAEAEGRYLFETFSSLTNRQNLALPYAWNSMAKIQQFQVKSGTTMITGNVAPQTSFGSQYVGGAKQWFINNLKDLIKCQ